MVICNIVYERMDEALAKYKDVEFVNLVDKHWKIKNDVRTLIYGYEFAKKLFPEEVNPSSRKKLFEIKHKIFWSYTENELSDQQWVEAFIRDSVSRHVENYSNNIDVLFNDFNMDHFIQKLSDWPLIHAGKYEIYVGDVDHNGAVVHSFQMDNLKYADIDPEKFFYQILRTLNGRCVVLSTDEIDLTQLENPPISFQDLAMASLNKQITLKSVFELINPYVDEITKEMIITFYLKHDLYSKNMFKRFV